jgi:hypothetical protein
MIILPSPIVRRRSHTARPRAADPVIPLLVAGVADVATGTENLRVDLALNTTARFPLLEPGELNYQRWSAVYNGYRYLGSVVTLLGCNAIRVHMEQDDAQAGDNAITFAGPTDASTALLDALGRSLAAFSALAI